MLPFPNPNKPSYEELLKLNHELKKENQKLKETISAFTENPVLTNESEEPENAGSRQNYSPPWFLAEAFKTVAIKESAGQSKDGKEKLKMYLEKIPLPCQSLNEHGQIIDVNPAWLNTLGHSKTDVIGRHFGLFLHPESKLLFEEKCFSFKSNHSVLNLYLSIRHKNGYYISTSFGGFVEFSPDGNFLRTYCFFQNMTNYEQYFSSYKAIVDNSQLGLFILSGMRIIFANAQTAKISGYAVDELLSLKLKGLSIIHPDDRQRVIKIFKTLGKNSELSEDLEFRILRKKSGIRWVHAYTSLIKYMGKPSFQIAFIDVSVQKETTQKLLKSKKRYHKMYRHTPAIMHAIDHESRLVEVSDFWLETMGYRREEVIGRRSVDFLTPESREFAVKKALPAFRKKGVARNIPLQFIKKNGEIIEVLLSAFTEYDNNGNVHRRLAIANDVTRQKNDERIMIESELKYRNLVENSPAGIIVFLNNQIELVNNAFLKLSGYKNMDEFKKISYDELVHPDDQQKIKSETDKNSSSEEALSRYYRLVRKDGRIIDVTEYISEFKIHNKIYRQCIFEDISQIIRAAKSRRIILDKTVFLERKLRIIKQAEEELLSVIHSENIEISKFSSILNLFERETEMDRYWQIFNDNLASLHPGFFNKLHSIAPKLTQQDLKHCAFIKMKLETKQIAILFNVKPSSVQMSRVRLKKKLGLKSHVDLFYFINSL